MNFFHSTIKYFKHQLSHFFISDLNDSFFKDLLIKFLIIHFFEKLCLICSIVPIGSFFNIFGNAAKDIFIPGWVGIESKNFLKNGSSARVTILHDINYYSAINE